MLYYLCIFWPYRLTVRTSAFQAGNLGSIPSRVTNKKPHESELFLCDPKLCLCRQSVWEMKSFCLFFKIIF